MLTSEIIRKRRKQLNKSRFPSEMWFEKELARNGIRGYRRNVPLLKSYFGDFVWRKKKLVVEIDGPSHLCKEKYDAHRDERLKNAGYIVIRVKWGDSDGLLNAIKELVKFLDPSNPRIVKTIRQLRIERGPNLKGLKEIEDFCLAHDFNLVRFPKAQCVHVRIGDYDFWPNGGKFFNLKTREQGKGFKKLVDKLLQKKLEGNKALLTHGDGQERKVL